MGDQIIGIQLAFLTLYQEKKYSLIFLLTLNSVLNYVTDLATTATLDI